MNKDVVSQDIPKCGRQWHRIDDVVDLEDPQEEYTKMIKHFGEEVPEQANVWCQVTHTPAGCGRNSCDDEFGK